MNDRYFLLKWLQVNEVALELLEGISPCFKIKKEIKKTQKELT